MSSSLTHSDFYDDDVDFLEKEPMSNEDYESVEHPRLELHLHVATKFVQVTMMMMMMTMRMLICRYDFGGDDALDGGCDLFHDDITAEILKGLTLVCLILIIMRY